MAFIRRESCYWLAWRFGGILLHTFTAVKCRLLHIYMMFSLKSSLNSVERCGRSIQVHPQCTLYFIVAFFFRPWLRSSMSATSCNGFPKPRKPIPDEPCICEVLLKPETTRDQESRMKQRLLVGLVPEFVSRRVQIGPK